MIGKSGCFYFPDRNGKRRTVRLTYSGWLIHEPDAIDVFGTAWIPLPLTPNARLATVEAHVLRLPFPPRG